MVFHVSPSTADIVFPEVNNIVNSTSTIEGVRIIPSKHGANAIGWRQYVENPDMLMQQHSLGDKFELWKARVNSKKYLEQLLRQGDYIAAGSLPRYTKKELKQPHVKILQSSFHNRIGNISFNNENGETPSLLFSENGLVWSVVYAYSTHHHLTLRPEDIWFSILTQFSAYLNAHGEEFRHLFVKHKGQKELVVYQLGNRHIADYRSLANDMGRLIQEEIMDHEFRKWIMPEFSTTTEDDKVLAAVLMMATMQKYFTYKFQLSCGFPSITLLGRRSDYEQILQKLDWLEGYGEEPAQFVALLRPIVTRFISSFDDPSAPAVLEFWQRAVHVSGGSGPSRYSGWITAFCMWDKDGKSLYKVDYNEWRKDERLELDGVQYGTVLDEHIPAGYSKVPVLIDDNGELVPSEMIAGSVGIACSNSGRRLEDGSTGLDSMQPVTAWWIAEV